MSTGLLEPSSLQTTSIFCFDSIFLLKISIHYAIPNSPHPMLTYCLNSTFSLKQSPLEKNANYSVYSVPKDLTRCNNIPQSINTSTKVMLLLPNDTKLNDIHLQFPGEHAQWWYCVKNFSLVQARSTTPSSGGLGR